MINERETITIRGGTDVFGSDGEKVGNVASAEGDYVVVSKGFFFPTDYYIPTSAINSATDDGVYLNVTKDAALNQGWDAEPASTYNTDTNYRDDRMMQDQTATEQSMVDQDAQGRRTDGSWPNGQSSAAQGGNVDGSTDGAYRERTAANSESLRVPLSEEELTAQKRQVDRGAVHIDKVVTEEQQALDVPVTEERVNVSRRVVDRDVATGDAAFEEGTIDIPVHGEEVDVAKRARVREEVEISKDSVQNMQQVKDTVRREEARVRNDTGTEIVHNATAGSGKGRKRTKKS
jgi:uncharacterized protein (TIGR02271 family)